MSDQLCDLLNEFYEDIRPDLAQTVFSAIRSAQNANEFSDRPEIYEALRRLILDLANPQQDDNVAINKYMGNTNTQGSSTRTFFYDYNPPRPISPLLPSRHLPDFLIFPPMNPIVLRPSRVGEDFSLFNPTILR